MSLDLVHYKKREASPEAEAEHLRALAAAEGREPAVEDPIARIWQWIAAAIGAWLVVTLLLS